MDFWHSLGAKFGFRFDCLEMTGRLNPAFSQWLSCRQGLIEFKAALTNITAKGMEALYRKKNIEKKPLKMLLYNLVIVKLSGCKCLLYVLMKYLQHMYYCLLF